MPRPAEARNSTSVGRGRDNNNKRAQKRPYGRKKKKITPFDDDEYNRMEHWRVSTSTKAENKRNNPVKRKLIGGRRKALQRYLQQVATKGDRRQRTKDLAKRINQAESAKRRRGSRASSRQAWAIWGARTENEASNDRKVIGRVMKWAGKEVARKNKNEAGERVKTQFNPRSIASPKRRKRGSQRRVTFANNIVTSVQMRPTTANEKKLFTTNADEKRARRDQHMCPHVLEYKREYKQQRRNLRRAMKKYQNDESTIQLTSAEQQRVDEHRWIEVKGNRKTNKLVSEEPSPVQCSNEYEALADTTIHSPPPRSSQTMRRATKCQ